ncbi:MAG: hypothetical protein Q9181_004039 [Wetmoreana brouardii]
MDHILTRVARRLKDACDEWIERVDDHEHGRRDKYGRRTQAWYEHDYQRQQRAKKRDARRKEKEARAKRKKEAEGGGGKKVVDTMMTGAIPSDGAGSHREGRSRDGSDTVVEQHATGIPKPEDEPVAQEALHEHRPEGDSASRDISPMPSEHSGLSMRGHAQPQRAEERAQARARAEAERENPPLFKDSEDEEPEASDDEDSDEEGEAAKAAKRVEEPAAAGQQGEASGLRGGGFITELDDDESRDDLEYDEHEDFDDEYASSATPKGASNAQDEIDVHGDKEIGDEFKSRERQPYRRSKSGLEAEEGIAYQPYGKKPERSRQPYLGPRMRDSTEVHYMEAANIPGPSRLKPSEKNGTPYWKAGTPLPTTKARRNPGPYRNGVGAGQIPRTAAGAQRAREGVAEAGPQLGHLPSDVPFGARNPQPGPFPCKRTVIFRDIGAIPPAQPKPRGAPYVPYEAGSGTSRMWENNRRRPYRPGPQRPRPQVSPTSDSEDDGSDSQTESDVVPEPRRPRKSKSKREVQESSSDGSGSSPRPQPKPSCKGTGKRRATREPPPPAYDSVMIPPLNHYAVLGLSENAAAREIKVTAKKKRVACHPDKHIREGMTEEEKAKINAKSARIGQAADVLENAEKKQEYDKDVREWKREHGGILPKEPE